MNFTELDHLRRQLEKQETLLDNAVDTFIKANEEYKKNIRSRKSVKNKAKKNHEDAKKEMEYRETLLLEIIKKCEDIITKKNLILY